MKETIIRPQKIFSFDDIKEIWNYRELFYVFAWRDIKVRYKQTMLGIVWVIFQPLITMLIFTFFFGKMAKIPSADLPYSLFVLCGLVFWTFFTSSLSHASQSMITHSNLIKKVYFPKILLPFSSFATFSIDFIINLVFLLLFASVIGYIPSIIGLVIIPFGILLTALTSIGMGLLFSAVNVKYRDVRYVLPFFIQLFLFVTPIIYPLAIASERNRFFMAFNPMSAVVESTRLIFSNNYTIYPELMIISSLMSVVILIIGIWYFRRTERFFADIV